MITTLSAWWRGSLHLLRVNLWLLPAGVGAAFVALAVAVLQWGPVLEAASDGVWWIFSGDARTARNLLSSLLSGMLTMTSLVVSMTFVVLTLSANQLGPRLTEILTSDKQVQTVLGIFIGTILYVLVVLRSLNDELGVNGVPHVAITVASALTVVCLIALLLYVHKVSRSIISDVVVEDVAEDLHGALDAALNGDEDAPGTLDRPPGAEWIGLGKAGYVQFIDYDRLVHVAAKAGVVLNVRVRAGAFVLARGRHIEIHGAASDACVEAIRAAVSVGNERSPTQDLEYSVRQLVEVALRSMSSGIKDPFTVVAVIDRLGSALERVLTGTLQARTQWADAEGAVRVIADALRVPELIRAMFDAIRQGGSDEPAIVIHLADTIEKLLAICGDTAGADALRWQLDALAESTRVHIAAEADRELCMAAIRAAQRTQPAVLRATP